MRHLIINLVVLTALANMGFAQDISSSSSDDAASRDTADEPSLADSSLRLPADLSDPPFDRFVDFTELGLAINSQDPARLADAGLQIAEGERVLRRTPKAKGITAERILRMAYELARDARDEETLSRLKKAFSSLGIKSLADSIEAADKLGGGSRTLLDNSTVPLSMPTKQFYLLKEYSDAIRRAKMLRDLKSLKSIQDAAQEQTDLPEEQRKQLLMAAANAVAAVEQNPAQEDDTLSLLADASRGWGFNDIRIPRPPTPPKKPSGRPCPYCHGDGWISDSRSVPKLQGTSRFDESTEDKSTNESALLEGGSRDFGWVTRPQDWGSSGIQIFPRREESVSTLQFVSEPSIDANGTIWSGSGSGGSRGSSVGRAQLRYNNQGLAFWEANYSNLYGRAKSPVRASRHDKGEPLGYHAGVKKIFDPQSAKWRIYEQRNGRWTLIEVTD